MASILFAGQKEEEGTNFDSEDSMLSLREIFK